MNLNKQMKKDVVLGLVGLAAKKHASAMGKAAQALAQSWEALLRSEAKAKLPDLSENRWADLLQSGTLVSQASGSGPELKVYRYGLSTKEGDKSPYETVSKSMGAMSSQYSSEDQYEKGYLLSAIKKHWPQFMDVFTVTVGSYYTTAHYFPRFAAIPYFNHTSQVYEAAVKMRKGDPRVLDADVVAFSQRAWPLVKISQDLGAKFMKIFAEAEQMREMLDSIVAPMKTVRQLLEQLPEASEFLPKEPPKRQELAPKEYVEKARRMLAEGIPT